MNETESEVECLSCGNWIRVNAELERAKCECGDEYAVTVTRM